MRAPGFKGPGIINTAEEAPMGQLVADGNAVVDATASLLGVNKRTVIPRREEIDGIRRKSVPNAIGEVINRLGHGVDAIDVEIRDESVSVGNGKTA